jgi:tellurite resistance-related uncharacterized protein
VIRTIDGFHWDAQGDWVAELSCLHGQHVRHQPPFRDRAWVTEAAGRDARIGSPVECPLCDLKELPPGLVHARTAGPFDAATVPAALRRTHLVADRTWGVLRVLEGAVDLVFETPQPERLHLQAGDVQPLPPGVPHLLRVEGPVRLAVDFLVRAAVGGTAPAGTGPSHAPRGMAH